jgi:putative hydrolase of the HAD superfamily
VKNNSIRNLIFDLGGVILDLSVESTLDEFSRISGFPKDKVKQIFSTSPEFNVYEKGGMNDLQFRAFISQTYAPHATDEQIDKAWNTMLKGLPTIKLDLLTSLKNYYRLFLLSNTNGIHLDYINRNLLPSSAKSLDDYFHVAYYSHRMLKRKPDAEIYEQVLAENNLKASETLFLDDNLSNIEAAKALGIQTVHVTHPDLILEYFK